MKYLIGKILKARGLKGELKVQILTNITNVFGKLPHVYLGATQDSAEKYIVTKSSVQNEFAYLFLKDVDSVERAEDFRGMEIYVDKSQLAIADDEILASDLVGCVVVTENGKSLGTVQEVVNYGGSDFLKFGKDVEIPYEDEFIVETNMTEKKVIIKNISVKTWLEK